MIIKSMAKVELKHLPKNDARPAFEYLSAKLGVKIIPRDSSAIIETTTDKEIRMLLGKFLHTRSLDDYRIVSGNGTVAVLPPRQPKVHFKFDTRTTAPVSVTMPYYFPGDSGVKPRARKKQ